MNISSRILNQTTIEYSKYCASQHASALSYSSCSQRSSSSSRAGGRKRKAGKGSTKNWVQRAFYSTPAAAGSKSSASIAPRLKKPVVAEPDRKKVPVPPDPKGEPSVYFSRPSIEAGAEKFKFCLVGKFPRRRPSLEQIREWASKEWKLQGGCCITLLDQNHVLIRLDNEADMIRVWPRNRWFVCGNLMKVFKWVPTFRAAAAGSSIEPSSAAVWISLPSLPVVLFQEEFLKPIARLVGRMLGMDGPTKNLSRTNVARVCVEVDLVKDLPQRVWIGVGDEGFWQDVIYERLPYYCTHCSRQGHSTKICKFKINDDVVDSAPEKVLSLRPCPKSRSVASRMKAEGSDPRQNVILEHQAQTCPAMVKIERKKKVTIAAATDPCKFIDSREKKRRDRTVEDTGEGSVDKRPSDGPDRRTHSSSNLATSYFGKRRADEVIGSGTKENENLLGHGTNIPISDADLSRKGDMIKGKGGNVIGDGGKSELEVLQKSGNTGINVRNTGAPSTSTGHRLKLRSAIFFWKRKMSREVTAQTLSSTSLHISTLSVSLCKRFTFAVIKRATKNFSNSQKIGEGGFGPVYRGIIDGGIEVAIKRKSKSTMQGQREFEAEVNFLSKVRHENVVTLIGYCTEKNEMILVYEFMACGSLKEHLYSVNAHCLSWKQRLEICIGAARGIHFLHTSGFIHRDVKSNNILISETLDAKISDLGLGRIVPDADSHVTTAVAGTIWYLDPEYFMRGILTKKSDVYSFGIVLFEVLSGKPPHNPEHSMEECGHLVQWAVACRRNGNFKDLVDPLLEGSIKYESLRKFTELAENCVSLAGAERPEMGEALRSLELLLQSHEVDDCKRLMEIQSSNNYCGTSSRNETPSQASHGSLSASERLMEIQSSNNYCGTSSRNETPSQISHGSLSASDLASLLR